VQDLDEVDVVIEELLVNLGECIFAVGDRTRNLSPQDNKPTMNGPRMSGELAAF
jgi:hypothetical protein